MGNGARLVIGFFRRGGLRRLAMILICLESPLAVADSYGLYVRTQRLTENSAWTPPTYKNWKDLFVQLTSLSPEQLSSSEIRTQRQKLKSIFPRARMWGWLGIRVCAANRKTRCFHFNRAPDQAGLMRKIKKIKEAGFDGVHLDFEPVSSGSRDLIHFLTALRRADDSPALISIAGMALAPEGAIRQELHPRPRNKAQVYFWSRSYYEELLPVVNHVMVMNYDTALPDTAAYSRFTAWQAGEFTRMVEKRTVEIQIGIPVYALGRSGVFDPKVENLRSATVGLRKTWRSGTPLPEKMGIAIFIEDEFDAADQAFFGSQWLDQESAPPHS